MWNVILNITDCQIKDIPLLVLWPMETNCSWFIHVDIHGEGLFTDDTNWNQHCNHRQRYLIDFSHSLLFTTI